MEIAYNNNEAKIFYQEVSSIRKGFNPHTLLIGNKTGHIVSYKEKIVRRWSEQYQTHFELQDGTDSDSGEVWTMCVQTAEPYGTDSDSGEVWTMCVQTADTLC